MAVTPAPGEIFAGYRLERRLGSGDRGTVYLAAHPRLPRHDALKVLAPGGSDEFTARFVREAELVARLEHPNIVRVYDRGIERGCLWLAMVYVDGIDAAALIRRSPAGVPAGEAVRIVTEAARGLDEAHLAGLLHRDVKPANILLESRPGEPDPVYISDFGVARPMADTEALTEAGSVLATLDYAAPELLAGDPADHRVDVYALGCTLFELLTGTVPFPRSSPAAQIRAHLKEPPPRPSRRNPDLPASFDAVIARALAKDPRRRYDSAGALAQAAAAALDGRVARRAGRRTVLGALAFAGVTVLVAATAVVWQGQWLASAPVSPIAPSTAPSASAALDGIRSWGAYGFIVQAFPALLPPTPMDSGYQEIRCTPIGADRATVGTTAPLGAVASMRCNGNGDPMDWLFVDCNVDRAAMAIDVDGAESVLGDQQWQRPSGTGRMVWGTGIGTGSGRGDDVDGQRTGMLDIRFDDPARSFCRLEAWGGATGQDLADHWWPAAPL
ncbi:serine/threonine-protein kinase [Nocardia sp. NPDC006630]|uniref:serine/threonine-protein kinase n=1 Tax=Nocardia sp. NPDC006630 TaxID=3157181 RepID=UPI0033BD70DD